MQILGEKNLIKIGLEIVEKALPVHSPLQTISNILLEIDDQQILFTATNLEIEIKCKIPRNLYNVIMDQQVTGTVRLLLPPKFSDIIKHLPSSEIKMNIDLESYKIELESGQARFDIYGADASEFPETDNLLNDDQGYLSSNAVILNQSEFRRILKRVIFAASNEETRPAFNGVLFSFNKEYLTLTASDTYRLVVKKLPVSFEKIEQNYFLIPAKSLRELMRIIEDREDELIFFPLKKQVVFLCDQVSFSSRLLSERFPDVSAVIPVQSKTVISVNKKEFEQSINRAALLAEGINQAIQLQIEENRLTVKVASQIGSMEEKIDIEQQGENVQVYVNSRFVVDILKVVDVENILIYFNGKNGPIVFKINEDPDYLYLVLPIKSD